MKIGFEAKRAFQNQTGLGNYARTIISNYHHSFPQDDLHLFSPSLKLNDWITESLHVHSCSWPKIAHTFWKTHGQAYEASKLKLDVYHGLSNELPHGQLARKKVVTIHDVIFWRYPELYRVLDRMSYFYKTQHAVKSADKIIAISRETAHDLVSKFGVDSSKIEIIYQTCHDQFRKKYSSGELKGTQEKYHLPHQFFLYVGTVEPRKNAMRILEAMLQMKNPLPLVMIGKGKHYLNEVKDFAKLHQLPLMHIENLPFFDLPLIYQLSHALIYPSYIEGFGIPVIEALFSGKPAIIADNPALNEAGGEGVMKIDPNSSDDLASVMQELINDSELYRQKVEAGLKHVQKFTPRVLSNQLRELYSGLI